MKPARVIPNSFVATLFREPREHVMSQYMECAFDYYWTAPTRDEGGVPGSRRGGSFAEKDFTAWLRHFQAWQPDMGDYNCYNPWNMQTRQMICTSADQASPHHVHDGEATEPPVPELEQLDFVGVTELYDESWCLLNWQLDGSLPDMCTCEYMGRGRPEKQSAARWHGGEVNEAHGTGPHPKADELGKSARELVDLVTASDRVLYSRAVARLLKDLCALDLLCPAQLAALKHRTRHLAGTQTAIDEASSWNCKAVLQLQTNASVVAGFGVRGKAIGI